MINLQELFDRAKANDVKHLSIAYDGDDNEYSILFKESHMPCATMYTLPTLERVEDWIEEYMEEIIPEGEDLL